MAGRIERFRHEFEHEIAVFARVQRARLVRLHGVDQRRAAAVERKDAPLRAQFVAPGQAVEQFKIAVHVHRGHGLRAVGAADKAFAQPAQIVVRVRALDIDFHGNSLWHEFDILM